MERDGRVAREIIIMMEIEIERYKQDKELMDNEIYPRTLDD
jgi:hypothetical protein